LQALAIASDVPDTQDSSVRQAIEDVLARVNLVDLPEADLAEEAACGDQSGPQQKSSSV